MNMAVLQTLDVRPTPAPSRLGTLIYCDFVGLIGIGICCVHFKGNY